MKSYPAKINKVLFLVIFWVQQFVDDETWPIRVSYWVQFFWKMEEVAQAARLRSSVWSSETLQRGMASITKQPCGLLAKSEEDESLVQAYNVARFNSGLYDIVC
jgi:hypothetical protein